MGRPPRCRISMSRLESPRRPSPESARYPLPLLTPNTKNRIHSQFNNLAVIRQFSPAPFLATTRPTPPPAASAEGDPVRVFNGRGECACRPGWTSGSRPAASS